MSKVEVSAIISGDSWFDALAITPCANRVFIFIRRKGFWVESVGGFSLWHNRVNMRTRGMKRVYHGAFTIEVTDEK